MRFQKINIDEEFSQKIADLLHSLAQLPVGVHQIPMQPHMIEDGRWSSLVVIVGNGNDPFVGAIKEFAELIAMRAGLPIESDPTAVGVRELIAHLRTLPPNNDALIGGPEGRS